MAPKKRVRTDSSSQPQKQQQQQPFPPIYINEAAVAASARIGGRPIVQERVMAIMAPQKDYIDRMGRIQFVNAGSVEASRSVVQEFYSNLAGQPAQEVFVRGRVVDISPAAINRFYGLTDYLDDGFSTLMQQEPSPTDISARLLTRSALPLLPDWHSIARGSLTTEAKNQAYFVGARLMPVKMASEVHKVRALLTYAIVTGPTVNVGRVIHRKMLGIGDGRSNRSMRFPSLITQLCAEAGVDVTSEDSADIIKPQPRITPEMYLHAEKARRRQRAAEEDEEEEEAHQQQHEQGDEGQGHEQGDDQGQGQYQHFQQYYQQPSGPIYLEPQLAALFDQITAHSALMTAQYEQMVAMMQQGFMSMSEMNEQMAALERHFPPPPP